MLRPGLSSARATTYNLFVLPDKSSRWRASHREVRLWVAAGKGKSKSVRQMTPEEKALRKQQAKEQKAKKRAKREGHAEDSTGQKVSLTLGAIGPTLLAYSKALQ